MDKKFYLHIGCHNGGITSRDSGVCEYDSIADCVESYTKQKKFWETIGYFVWFAYVKDTDGHIVIEWPSTQYWR